MPWYFAYGSNMNPARLAERRVPVAARVCGRLDGWRLSFNKLRDGAPAHGAANILPAPGTTVWGTLNETTEAGLAELDKYEGIASGQYRRDLVNVMRLDTGATVEAVTYVALRLGAEDLRPRRDYLAHLLLGRDLLPAEYFRRLECQECVD